jgi:WD40 repeat protein
LTTAVIVTTALLGSAAISIVVHNANLSRYNRELKQLNEDLKVATVMAQTAQREAEINERRTRNALYAADISRAALSLRGNDPREVRLLLDRHAPRAGEPDGRGFEWWYLHRRIGLAHRVLLEVGTPLYLLSPSPDGRVLAAVGQDAILRLLDPETGATEREIETGQIEVNGVAFAPDGKELATAGDDGTIRIWNLSTLDERLKIAAHPAKAFELFYTPDGTRIVSCGNNPVIRIFSAETGRLLQALDGHASAVQSLLLADPETLVSTGDDCTARVWSLTTATEVARVTSARPIGAVAVAADRNLLITGNDRHDIETWRLPAGTPVSQVKHLDGVHSLALHPNGRLLAAGDHAGSIHLWALDAAGTISREAMRAWQAHQGRTYSLVWSRDGSRLTSAGKDGRVVSWSLAALETNDPKRFRVDPSGSFSLIPRTTSLVTAGRHHAALVKWDWQSGIEEDRFADSMQYGDISVSPNGRLLAGVWNERVLDVLPVHEVFRPAPHAEWLSLQWNPGGTVGEPQFSPDSRAVAVPFQQDGTTGHPEERRLWLHGAPDFRRREEIPIPGAMTIAFSPVGRELAVATVTGLVVWDISRRSPRWERAQPDTSLVAFSQDGALLVTGGLSRKVIVWNSDNGQIRFDLASHQAPITSLSIAPDSSTLATASRDGVIKLWHLPTGQELFELRGAGPRCTRLEFASDGRHLLALVDGGPGFDEVLVYDASNE